MKLILASASPRRRELLENIGLRFEICIPDTDESCDVKNPELFVKELSRRKARAVIKDHGDALVIAADTVVFSEDGGIMGKPKDEKDALRMLGLLSGKKHTVFTGVSVGDKNGILTDYSATDVYFRTLEDGEAEEYIKKDSPLDKAGAYGIQSKAAIFVDRIDGCYFNVVGLPLSLTCQLLKEKGGDVWALMT